MMKKAIIYIITDIIILSSLLLAIIVPDSEWLIWIIMPVLILSIIGIVYYLSILCLDILSNEEVIYEYCKPLKESEEDNVWYFNPAW